MMKVCPSCQTSGPNMKRCTRCNENWCANCARQGKGDYPRAIFTNQCPYCGMKNTVVRLT